MKLTARQVAEKIGATVEGEGTCELTGVAAPERAGKKIQEIVLKERDRTLEQRRDERVGPGAVAASEKRRRNVELNVQRILESF